MKKEKTAKVTRVHRHSDEVLRSFATIKHLKYVNFLDSLACLVMAQCPQILDEKLSMQDKRQLYGNMDFAIGEKSSFFTYVAKNDGSGKND